MKVVGSVALVTGASGGIGAAIAEELARRGASVVVLVARTQSALEEVATRVAAHGARAVVIPCDVADHSAVAELERALKAQALEPNILVNNAGAGRWLAVDETPAAELQSMMAAPAMAAFWVTQICLPAMLARRSGAVLCVNSPASMVNFPGATGYSMSRWALRGFADGLRADVYGTGIEVCHFVVGKVSSPYFDHNPGSEARIPALSKLIGTLTPEETARRAVSAIERGRGWVHTPIMVEVFRLMNVWFPGVVRYLLIKTGWRR